MRNLGIVVLGFGRMGRAGLASFHQISARLQNSGIHPCLLAVLEADEDLIRELPNHTDAKPIFVDTRTLDPGAVSRLLRRELDLGREHEFLVYDATPSNCHRRNLVDICGSFPQALYIGEKPLFTDRAGLAALENFRDRVLCDFIESQNEAVLKLLDMQRGGFRIRRLRFWRLNSTGLAKLSAPHTRAGVTGGALLDKGIHDLALASILMRHEGSAQAVSHLEDARNLAFMPEPARFDEIASTSGAPPRRRIPVSSNGATDAAGYAKVRWTASRQVDAEFRYSWIGVELFDDLCAGLGHAPLRTLLHEIGFEESAWLARALPTSFSGFEQQEARILLVDGAQAGKNTQLVVNFLSRPGVEPFIFHAGKGEFLDLSERPYCESSLARVFAFAIRNYVNRQPLVSTSLGATVIHEAHRLTFDIRDQAFSKESASPADMWIPSLSLAGE